MNKLVYKLSRPSHEDKDVDLVIYLETLCDVYKALLELNEDLIKETHLDVIPIVHY